MKKQLKEISEEAPKCRGAPVNSGSHFYICKNQKKAETCEFHCWGNIGHSEMYFCNPAKYSK
jgi:hypothetical protein